jgi:phosphomannomutase
MIRPSEKLYVCPGESYPITRAVHLSRLAAFFPACRDCPFRSDTGRIPPQTLERLESTVRRVERKSLFTTEGVRGVYLNELTRAKAGEIAAALAALLWEQSPLVGLQRRAGQAFQPDAAVLDVLPAPPCQAG